MSATTRLVRPFPWGSLDSTTKEQAAIVQDVRRWAAAHVNLASIAAVASELLEADVDVLVGRARTLRTDRPFDDGMGVLLAAADGAGPGPGVLFDAERALGAAVVARALRRAAPRVVDPAPAAPSPAFAGAFSAAVAAIARRAHAGTQLRVVRAGPSAALEAELARGVRDLVQVALTIIVEQEAFSARAVVSRGACRAAAPHAFSAADLRALGPTPLAMQVVACTSRVRAVDLGALRLGDALVPRAWPLSRSAGGALRGPAWLSAPDADSGIPVELGDDGRLVLRAGVEPFCAAENAMAESDEHSALISAVGDLPVVVKVEIGEARMQARQWAALACGDVVTLGRRVGESVVLRVGGVAIARGELVEIDGEVGVRVAERLNTDRTTT